MEERYRWEYALCIHARANRDNINIQMKSREKVPILNTFSKKLERTVIIESLMYIKEY